MTAANTLWKKWARVSRSRASASGKLKLRPCANCAIRHAAASSGPSWTLPPTPQSRLHYYTALHRQTKETPGHAAMHGQGPWCCGIWCPRLVRVQALAKRLPTVLEGSLSAGASERLSLSTLAKVTVYRHGSPPF